MELLVVRLRQAAEVVLEQRLLLFVLQGLQPVVRGVLLLPQG
jgi:hypothetical protein